MEVCRAADPRTRNRNEEGDNHPGATSTILVTWRDTAPDERLLRSWTFAKQHAPPVYRRALRSLTRSRSDASMRRRVLRPRIRWTDGDTR